MNELIMRDNKYIDVRNKALLIPPISVNPSLPMDEELFYMLTDRSDRKKLLDQEINKIVNEHIPPQISFKVDKNDGSNSIYEIAITQFGFTLTEIKNYERDVITSNFFNKDLSNDFDYIDIEFLRGLIALLILNLQKQIDDKIEAFDMLYSPNITEYLTHCIEYLKAKRKIKTK